MAYEELIRSMEMDAEFRMQEVRKAARACAEETLEAARGRAAEIRAGHRDDVERRIEVERHQRLYRAREEVKAGLAQVREEYLRRAMAAAHAALARQRGQRWYAEVMERLIREALEALGEGGARLHVDPRDEETVRALLPRLPGGLPMMPDLETGGGVAVDSADGRIRVDNTFDSRLARAGEVYRRELFDRLIGGR